MWTACELGKQLHHLGTKFLHNLPPSVTFPIFMQCHRAAWRSYCTAQNAYNPTQALRAAFGTTVQRRQSENADNAHETALPLLSQHGTQPTSDSGTQRRGMVNARKVISVVHRADRKGGRQQIHRTLPLPSQNDTRPSYNSGDQRRDMEILRENIAVVHSAERGGKGAKERFSVDSNHLSYTGKCILPWGSKESAPVKRISRDTAASPRPWRVDTKYLKPLAATDFGGALLDEEIRRFARWIEPTEAERVARQTVANEVDQLLQAVLFGFKNTAWSIFGSSKTGLFSPVSDIDVRIYDTRDMNADEGRKPHAMVDRFYALRAFMNHDTTFVRPTIRHGRFPLLNFTHAATGIEIQLVASNDTSPQNEVMSKYLEEIPRLQEVFYVVRAMFSMRGFLDVWSGGLGSYGLFIMLVAALKRYAVTHPGLPMFASTQLFAFFLFYSPLDMQKHGVSVSRHARFLKHDPDPKYQQFAELAAKRGDPVRAGQWLIGQKRPLTHWLLCLQDPADPTNDLGRRAHAIKHIQQTIKKLFKQAGGIRTSTAKLYSSAGADHGQYESILTLIVGKCDERWHERRMMMETYGQEVMARERYAQMVMAGWEREGASRSPSAAAGDAEAAAQELEKEFYAGQDNEGGSAAKN